MLYVVGTVTVGGEEAAGEEPAALLCMLHLASEGSVAAATDLL